MGEAIEGGIVSEVAKSAGNLFNAVFSWLGEESSKYEIKEEKPVKDDAGNDVGFIALVSTANGKEVKCKCLYSSGTNDKFIDCYFLADTGKKGQKARVKVDEFEAVLDKFIQDTYGLDSLEESATETISDVNDDFVNIGDFNDVNSSKKLQVRLSKIEGSTDLSLAGIFCNYNNLEAYDDLEELLENEEFVASIPEVESICYEVVPADDEIMVEEISEFDEMPNAEKQVAEICLTFAIRALRGYENCQDTRSKDEMMAIVADCINKLTILMRNPVKSFDFNSIIKNLDVLSDDYVEVVDSYDELKEQFATCLDLQYCNASPELQNLLGEWLRYLRYSMF